MLMDPMGGIVMTNDGNAILREITVQHPAAKSMIEIARTQDEEVVWSFYFNFFQNNTTENKWKMLFSFELYILKSKFFFFWIYGYIIIWFGLEELMVIKNCI